ncbi:hypothetical protein BV898_01061 [Hypsibius exemplaris]|uniref:G-protein coupled receptors family 1 profile domain-containing protein n=1 Tax=Hypsibius exemplaris TaxID=2072580 RepID=A0A1W0XD30_HYPEX|nr:hypothetical protein BV898_01061 [Hypsibius exemplaris]
MLALVKPKWWRFESTIRQALSALSAVFTLENLVQGYYAQAHDSTLSQILSPPLLRWSAIQNQAEVAIMFAKWTILVVINVILIRTFLRIRKDPMNDVKKVRRKRTIITVLLLCVAVYVVTYLPTVVYKILEIASRPPYCTFNFTTRDKERGQPFVFMAVLTNYFLNFLLYYLAWPKFRSKLRTLLAKVFCCHQRGTPTTPRTLVRSASGGTTSATTSATTRGTTGGTTGATTGATIGGTTSGTTSGTTGGTTGGTASGTTGGTTGGTTSGTTGGTTGGTTSGTTGGTISGMTGGTISGTTGGTIGGTTSHL